MHPALYSITTCTSWSCSAKRDHLNAEKGYCFVAKQKVKLECQSRSLHDRPMRPCAYSDPVSRHGRYFLRCHQTTLRPHALQNLELTDLKKVEDFSSRAHFLWSEAPSMRLVQSFLGAPLPVFILGAPTATSQCNSGGHECGLERTRAFPGTCILWQLRRS